MAITTRQNLIDYCLRKLGHPVLEINVDDDQIEDRIDEAFQFYREFHFDAVEKVYAKEQLLPSNVIVTANATSFTTSDIITGSTSGASATVYALPNVTTIQVYDINGTFTNGEIVTGSQSGQTATLAAAAAVTKGNYDNKYITLPESIIGVERIVQLTNKSNGISMFDVRYQLMLNNIQSLTNTDIIYYAQLKTHLNLINDLMTGQKPVRFNRHMNRLYIDMAWSEDVEVGDYVIVEGWQTLDPDAFTDVYNDYFLKKYATQLIKQQWGTNLKKFEGVQLPGGVTLNGQKIFDEAMEEIKELKDEVRSTYELPVDFFTG
jgi:hypothetical protein